MNPYANARRATPSHPPIQWDTPLGFQGWAEAQLRTHFDYGPFEAQLAVQELLTKNDITSLATLVRAFDIPFETWAHPPSLNHVAPLNVLRTMALQEFVWSGPSHIPIVHIPSLAEVAGDWPAHRSDSPISVKSSKISDSEEQ